MIGIDWQRYLAFGIAALAVAAALVGFGYHLGVRELWEYQGKEAKEAVRLAGARAKATERVIVQYVRVKGETQVVTKEVEKEVIRYVDKNPGLCLDAEWRRLHDAAAANAVPGSAGGADEAGGAPRAAEALETVSANYAACHRTADRLDALQAWIRAQQAVR